MKKMDPVLLSLHTCTHLSLKSLCIPSRSHNLKKAAGLRWEHTDSLIFTLMIFKYFEIHIIKYLPD